MSLLRKEAQVAGLPGSHRKRAAGLGPGLLTPVQCPPHHTHCLPPMAERLLGLASPGLSLSGSSPQTQKAAGGQLPGFLGVGEPISYTMPWVAHLKGSSRVGIPRRQVPSPSRAFEPPVLQSGAASCHCPVVTRPSRGSCCPGSDLTLSVYSSFPRAKR